jgi:serine/threonine protein kinase
LNKEKSALIRKEDFHMDEIGRLLSNRYRLIKVLGRGGTSIVYLAMDLRLKKYWAVKKIFSENLAEYKQQLREEVCILKRLNHPMLPKVIDLIEEEQLYIVMDYINGKNLSTLIQIKGRFSTKLIIEWGIQLAQVLKYLHQLEPPIIYQDMKPANIIITAEGEIKLIDFGISRAGTDKQKKSLAFGTRGFAAPEQYGNQEGYRYNQVDVRADIYGLGRTLESIWRVTEDFSYKKRRNFPRLNIHPVERKLWKVIRKCIKENPEKRYSSCSKLLLALESISQRKRKGFERKKYFMGIIIILGVTGGILLENTHLVRNREVFYSSGLLQTAKEQFLLEDYESALSNYKKLLKETEEWENAFDGILDIYTIKEQRKRGLAYLGEMAGERSKMIKDALYFKVAYLYFYEYSSYGESLFYFNRIEEKTDEVQSYIRLASCMNDFSEKSFWEIEGELEAFQMSVRRDMDEIILEESKVIHIIESALLIERIYGIYEIKAREYDFIQLFEKGLEILKGVSEKHPKRIVMEKSILIRLCFLYEQTEAYEETLKSCGEVLELLARGSYERMQIQCLKGRMYVVKGELDLAYETFQQGIRESKAGEREAHFVFLEFLIGELEKREMKHYLEKSREIINELSEDNKIEQDIRFQRLRERFIILEEIQGGNTG